MMPHLIGNSWLSSICFHSRLDFLLRTHHDTSIKCIKIMPFDALMIDFYRLHAFSPSVTVITFIPDRVVQLSCGIECSRRFREAMKKEWKNKGIGGESAEIPFLQFIKHDEKTSSTKLHQRYPLSPAILFSSHTRLKKANIKSHKA